MKRKFFLPLGAALGLLLCAVTQPAPAQELFYQGKTIRIIVGSDPGGGFDTYSRTIARHMSKHIPGNPIDCGGEYAGRSANDLGQLPL